MIIIMIIGMHFATSQILVLLDHFCCVLFCCQILNIPWIITVKCNTSHVSVQKHILFCLQYTTISGSFYLVLVLCKG